MSSASYWKVGGGRLWRILALSVAPLAIISAWGFAAYWVHSNVPGQDISEKIEKVPLLYTSVLVGSGALMAALIAFLASILKTTEDALHAEEDRKVKKRGALLLAMAVSHELLVKGGKRKEVAERMEVVGFDADQDGGGEQISARNDRYLYIDTPRQMEELWGALGLLPRKITDQLIEQAMALQDVQASTAPSGKEKGVHYVHSRDVLVGHYDRLIASGAVIKEECARLLWGAGS